MKILYLCNRKTFETKMSRVRFHGISALGKAKGVRLKYSGKGWCDYDDKLTVDENIKGIYGDSEPDWIIAYKPLELNGFSDSKFKRCIRYNEMWDVKGTRSEIRDSKPDLVVCHHLNDMQHYTNEETKMVNISHCAEETVYMDFGHEKEYDVLFTGAVSRHYPFRKRLRNIMREYLSARVKCKVLGHPGGDLTKSTGAMLEDYAEELNKAKIVLTCSSKYKYRLGKYVEVPMCHSVLAGDLPDEDQEFFKEFMLVLDPKDTDLQIAEKILSLLRDEDRLEQLTKKGVELNKEYTQKKYAERLLKQLEETEKWK